MGFSRQEYWSGLPFPSPGDLPDPGIEPRSPALQADALTSEPPGKPHTHLGMLIKLSSNCPAQETDSQSHLLLTCYSSFSVQSSSSPCQIHACVKWCFSAPVRRLFYDPSRRGFFFFSTCPYDIGTILSVPCPKLTPLSFTHDTIYLFT